MSVTAQHLNGVDTATLFATIDAVRQQPEAAKFQFRTTSEWVSGTHSRGRFPGFFGAGQEHVHASDTVIDADHPAVLVGTDQGPTPGRAAAQRAGLLPDGRSGQHRRRPAGSSCTASAARSRATSTCAASSVSTRPSATGSRTSGSPSRSTVTPRPRSWSRWCASRRPAPRSSTCSPTAPRSRPGRAGKQMTTTALRQPRVRATDVSRTTRGRTLVDRVSLTVEAGEMVALIGGSGAGKTSLLETLIGAARAHQRVGHRRRRGRGPGPARGRRRSRAAGRHHPPRPAAEVHAPVRRQAQAASNGEQRRAGPGRRPRAVRPGADRAGPTWWSATSPAGSASARASRSSC